jgi:hypothetical protein
MMVDGSIDNRSDPFSMLSDRYRIGVTNNHISQEQNLASDLIYSGFIVHNNGREIANTIQTILKTVCRSGYIVNYSELVHS